MVTNKNIDTNARKIDKKRVFSGIQPSGNTHLGNYLGAIKGWVDHQEEKENFFCIVDLHAITVPQDSKNLRLQTLSLAALLFASGIDPNKSTLFIQGHVTAHAEACWILNCITPVGWLERMTQYKDKSTSQETVCAGLLDYPVLMAADILMYDAHEVPVGNDQKQHVELSRNIAQRFNRIYGNIFIIPEPVIPKVGARVMGLDNPDMKMSKTSAHIRGHSIGILDDPKEIERSIKRSVTDSMNQIQFSDDPSRAGVNNLLGIYKAITGKNKSKVEADFHDVSGYGELKHRVSDVIIDELTPIRERYHELMKDVAELDRLLQQGAEQAKEISMAKLNQIKNCVGLTTPE